MELQMRAAAKLQGLGVFPRLRALQQQHGPHPAHPCSRLSYTSAGSGRGCTQAIRPRTTSLFSLCQAC